MKTRKFQINKTKKQIQRTRTQLKEEKKPLTGGASQHKAEVPQKKKNPKHSGLEYSYVDI